jgi:hypothetical protein
MADSFTKTYQVTVTFSKETPAGESAAITDSEIQSLQLRAEIQEAVGRACLRSKGNYNAIPGTVTET